MKTHHQYNTKAGKAFERNIWQLRALLLVIGLVLFGCDTRKASENPEDYTSETLTIQKVTNHVYQHTSFLNTQSFGKVPCNGMIVFDAQEAIIFDTPADAHATVELIGWVEDTLHCKVKAIIPTHFHTDCLGGLNEFHQRHIPSYANNLTITLAGNNDATLPEHGFDRLLELKVGDKQVLAAFVGEGHTKDNIIGYFPDEKVMFGGCLIKEQGAGKGYLEDANVPDWPVTVAKLKAQYPAVQIIIPGHGERGNTSLLDYTIDLFAQKNKPSEEGL